MGGTVLRVNQSYVRFSSSQLYSICFEGKKNEPVSLMSFFERIKDFFQHGKKEKAISLLINMCHDQRSSLHGQFKMKRPAESYSDSVNKRTTGGYSQAIQNFNTFSLIKSMAVETARNLFVAEIKKKENDETVINYYIVNELIHSDVCHSAGDIDYIKLHECMNGLSLSESQKLMKPIATTATSEKKGPVVPTPIYPGIFSNNNEDRLSLPVNPSQQVLSVNVKNAQVLDVNPCLSSDPGSSQSPNPDAMKTATNDFFAASPYSGANKTFVLINGHTALLRANNTQGEEDFKKEYNVQQYVDKINNPELTKYISTQRKINPPDVPHLDPGYQYATIDNYTIENCDSLRADLFLERTLPRLNDSVEVVHQKFGQLRSFSCQLFNALRLLNEYRIVHNDLHLENMKVYIHRDSRECELKIFDFGRSSILSENDQPDQSDVKYVFCRKGAGLGETVVRNMAPEKTRISQKHYPLHKIMKGVSLDETTKNYVDNFLEQLGKGMLDQLENESLKNKAFTEAFNQVDKFMLCAEDKYIANMEKFHSNARMDNEVKILGKDLLKVIDEYRVKQP